LGRSDGNHRPQRSVERPSIITDERSSRVRLVNLEGRLQVSTPGGLVDIAAASHGDFSGDPEEIYDRWAEFVAWYEENRSALTPTDAGGIDLARVGSPSPRPRQVFGRGVERGVRRPREGARRRHRRRTEQPT
jgi:hypothetical protein